MSLVVVAAATWLYCERQQAIHIAPFNRSVYDKMCIDFGDEVLVSIRMAGTNRTYSIGGAHDQRRGDISSVNDKLRRLASFSRDLRVCVAFDPSFSLSEIEDCISEVRQHGFTQIRILIEPDSSLRDDENSPMFKEMIIGPHKGIGWHQYEWYVQAEKERLSNQALHGD